MLASPLTVLFNSLSGANMTDRFYYYHYMLYFYICGVVIFALIRVYIYIDRRVVSFACGGPDGPVGVEETELDSDAFYSRSSVTATLRFPPNVPKRVFSRF
jgi:hypothetical protein